MDSCDLRVASETGCGCSCLFIRDDTSVLGFVTNNNAVAVAAANDIDDGRRATSAYDRDAAVHTMRWRFGPPPVTPRPRRK